MIDRPYLTSLVTPVKGRSTVSLGKRVVVVGNNAAGKSRIGQSISLLAGGYADGVDGRNDVRGSRLARLSSPLPLEIEGRLSDGSSVDFRLNDRQNRPEWRTPAQKIRQTLQSGDAAVKQEFMRWATSGVTKQQIVSLILDEDARVLFTRHFDAIKEGIPTERLIAIRDLAKKAKADRSKEAKGAQKIVDGLVAPLMPVSDNDVTDARHLCDKLAERLELSIRVAKDNERRRQIASLCAEADVKRAEIATAEETVSRLRKLREMRMETVTKDHMERQVMGPADGDADFHKTALAMLELSKGRDLCACCGGETSDKTRRTWVEFHQQRLRLIDVDLTDDPLTIAYDKSIAEDEQELVEARFSLASTLSTIDTLNRSITTEGGVAAEPVSESLVASARTRLEELIRDRAIWTQIEDARRKAKTMKKEGEVYGELETACDEAIAHLLRQHVGAFTAEVSKRLPGWDFKLNVIDGFDWSVDKHDGRSHEALSGTEFETIVMALAETVIDRMGYVGWAVNQPDDRGWSAENLTATMRALSNSTCQIIIESTVRPDDVEGWVILDAAERAAIPEPAVFPLPENTGNKETPVGREPVKDAHRKFLNALGWEDSEIEALTTEQRVSTIKAGRRRTQEAT